jgi:CO/xanthine dehydrogenase FAD-binding subunit
VDISTIAELHESSVTSTGVTVGAATTITELEQILRNTSSENAEAATSFEPLADHLLKIAGWHVRNMASIAGNLVMAKKHGFLSDLATVMLGSGAQITITGPSVYPSPDPFCSTTLTMEEFFARPPLAPAELLTAVHVPFAPYAMHASNNPSSTFFFRTFRVALRAQMCHAYTNAAFLVEVSGGQISQARLAFNLGGAHAVRAQGLEEFICGKPIGLELSTAAYHNADKLVVVDPPNAYVSSVVCSFIFKFLVALQADTFGELPAPLESCMQTAGGFSNSGNGTSRRVLSTGSQSFDYPTDHAPISEPIRKVGVDLQAAGEALYTGDIKNVDGTLYGALALSNRPKADLKLNLERASSMPGVERIVTAADIPNNTCDGAGPFMAEPVLADGSTDHPGQPIAVVLADTTRHAEAAAKVLEQDVEYTDHDDACISLEQAMQMPEKKDAGGLSVHG